MEPSKRGEGTYTHQLAFSHLVRESSVGACILPVRRGSHGSAGCGAPLLPGGDSGGGRSLRGSGRKRGRQKSVFRWSASLGILQSNLAKDCQFLLQVSSKGNVLQNPRSVHVSPQRKNIDTNNLGLFPEQKLKALGSNPAEL